MIQFVENNKIDKRKWDACLSGSSNASVFAYSWYLDVVCEDWSALILNDYEAVFPLGSRTKYKVSYLIQPFFSRYFGVFSKNKISEDLVTDFLNAIPEKFKYVEFCLNENNTVKTELFELKEKRFQILDLNKSYESIQKEYSDNAKRNIKKAKKSELTIKKDVSPETVVNLFKTTKGNELEVFNDDDYRILIRLMEICNKNEKGSSVAIYDGEKLCAAAYFMFNDNCFTFLKSGVTDEGKSKGAMHLLFDHFIKTNCENTYMLDFGGSSVDNVARFYKNFGAKDCLYLQLKRNNLPKLVKWIKSLKK